MDKAALAVRADQWRQIVDECNRSSLCKTEWCRKNSIRFRSLMYWQKKFRDQALLIRAFVLLAWYQLLIRQTMSVTPALSTAVITSVSFIAFPPP